MKDKNKKNTRNYKGSALQAYVLSSTTSWEFQSTINLFQSVDQTLTSLNHYPSIFLRLTLKLKCFHKAYPLTQVLRTILLAYKCFPKANTQIQVFFKGSHSNPNAKNNPLSLQVIKTLTQLTQSHYWAIEWRN